MSDLLHSVADGGSIGDLRVIGNGGNQDRHAVLATHLGDDRFVSLVAEQGHGFDQAIETRGPIGFGSAAVRGRFARLAGEGGIELAAMVWGEDPRRANNGSKLIAQTRNFTVWHGDWQEYALALIGREADWIARDMGNLWIRVVTVAPVSGGGGDLVPTLGVAALWLEVPSVDSHAFNAFPASQPPENVFVTVCTFSGRVALARYRQGEWYDEAGQNFEVDKHSLPLGPDGRLQASRAVKSWRL